MTGKKKIALVFLSICVLNGCGKREEKTASVGEPAGQEDSGGLKIIDSAAPPPAVVRRPAPTQPTQPPRDPVQEGPVDSELDAAFQAALTEIARFEAETEFNDAYKAARDARDKLKGHPRHAQIEEAIQRLKEARRRAVGLPYAIRNLGSAEPAEVAVARQELMGAGEVGFIFLRRAIRTTDNAKVATEATKILATMRDEAAVPLLMAKLQEGPPDELREALKSAVRQLAGKANAETLAEMYQLVKADTTHEHRDMAGRLCQIYVEEVDRDKDKFGELVGDPDARNALREYVRNALASDDAAIQTWGEKHAPVIGVIVNGLRGTYFKGQGLEEVLFERLDTAFPATAAELRARGANKQDLSIRWTGYLRVPEKDEYRFYFKADDGFRVWLHDKPIADVWHFAGGKEHKAGGVISKGMHPIKIEYHNKGASGHFSFEWKAKKMDRRPVGKDDLFTPAWSGMKTE